MRGLAESVLVTTLSAVVAVCLIVGIAGLITKARQDLPPTCYEASLLSQPVSTMSDGTVMGLAAPNEVQFRICFKELEVTPNER